MGKQQKAKETLLDMERHLFAVVNEKAAEIASDQHRTDEDLQQAKLEYDERQAEYQAIGAAIKAIGDNARIAAERDRLRAELADRDAEIAGLRESARKVLDVPASYDDFGNMIVSAEDRNSFITALSDALSRTPDQHRARKDRKALYDSMRDVCRIVGGMTNDGVSVDFLAHIPAEVEAVLAEARRDGERYRSVITKAANIMRFCPVQQPTGVCGQTVENMLRGSMIHRVPYGVLMDLDASLDAARKEGV